MTSRGDSSSGSFLSEAQRSALDAALAAKAAENAAIAKIQAKSSAGVGDRKSRCKGSGTAKKGGGGGKYTWGSLGWNGEDVALDRNDPNYDSDEERGVVLTQQDWVKREIQNYKREVKAIVVEYFESGDVGEVAVSLEDLGAPDFMHYFVKRALVLALDRKDREREMTSVLLSSLYAEVIPPEQVRKGFMSVVDSIEDTLLDVPDAPELLAQFIARAVVDDVLPPAIVAKIPDATPTFALLKSKVEVLLSTKHSAEKILRCWGGGAGLTHGDTKASISQLLSEYVNSHDADEASRCLRALSVPFFHHELVKQALHTAMGAPSSRDAILSLLSRFAKSGEISPTQMVKGLARVSDNLTDLCLDNPSAKEEYDAVMLGVADAKLVDEQDVAAPPVSVTRSDSLAASTGATGVPAAHSVGAFKAACAKTIVEYFDSGDAGEVARRLVELDDPGLLHMFVKQSIVMSLDRKDKERELMSVLLCHLAANHTLSPDQVSMGYTRLLAATDDLVLDCPDAVRLLSLFLGRAIIDEALAPSFLTSVLPSLLAESLGVSVVRAAGALLSARHGAERLSGCWHGGALSLEQVKAQIRTAVREYVGSLDVSETSRCLSELGMPFYHHGVVVEAVELAFEQESKAEELTALLAALGGTGVISQTQMSKGFSRIKARLEEEAIDYGPGAKDTYRRIVEQGTQGGWLSIDADVLALIAELKKAEPNTTPDFFDFEEGSPVVIWNASLVLLHHLIEREGALKGKRVLELGSGLGHLAVGLARVGAHVTCSELPSLMPDLNRSIELQLAELGEAQPVGSIEAVELEWGEEGFARSPLAAAGAQPFDVIISAELVYSTQHHDKLIWTIGRFSHPSVVIWSVLLDRPFSFAFFGALHDVGRYEVEDVPDFDALGMEKELLAMHRITLKDC
ncbi:hypothetical protein FOA52_015502 [Chlamydomonas sp. UWO 241]|nr:hypothetical protein FOA52_015502 [Chlamydomonas sp. UWO 241]